MDGKNPKKRGRPFTSANQPPAESKRVKKKRTIMKELVGLESWESVQNYLLTDGAAKFIESLSALEDKAFVFTYLQAMEYFKPKLARTEITGGDGNKLEIIVKYDEGNTE